MKGPGKEVTDFDWATCTGKIKGRNIVFLRSDDEDLVELLGNPPGEIIEWECYYHDTSTWDHPNINKRASALGYGETIEAAAIGALKTIEDEIWINN